MAFQGSVTLLIVGFYVPKINILSELNKIVSEKIFQNSHESINGQKFYNIHFTRYE